MTLHLGILQTDSVWNNAGRFAITRIPDAIFTADNLDLRITTYNVRRCRKPCL